ncbi:MAG TPA: xanthine dehydrogenase molybdopterin binding subunit, partial [Paracoccus sp.]|nr:xanthine dehydrogenase molybdopterin binding subunit [Paracoccus sp. (in: a-proteobacteria)]
MKHQQLSAPPMDTPHESARRHVTGTADYTDDLVLPQGALHAYLGLSTVAHGRILSMELSAVREAPGVIDVLTAEDIPGRNDVSPIGKGDDPILAPGIVHFHGQPVFAVIAETRDQARRAAALARIEYQPLPHALDPLAALA